MHEAGRLNGAGSIAGRQCQRSGSAEASSVRRGRGRSSPTKRPDRVTVSRSPACTRSTTKSAGAPPHPPAFARLRAVHDIAQRRLRDLSDPAIDRNLRCSTKNSADFSTSFECRVKSMTV